MSIASQPFGADSTTQGGARAMGKLPWNRTRRHREERKKHMGTSFPVMWQAVADLDGQERVYDLMHRCDTAEEAVEAIEHTIGRRPGRFLAAWREQGRRVRVLNLARLPGFIDRSGR